MSFLIKPLYRVYSKVIIKIRQNKQIFYSFFAFYPEDRKYKNYWDWTTLELRKILKKNSGKALSLLDMGTGPYAVLAIYGAIKLNYKQITACDKIEELLLNAKKQRHSDKICLIHSDLFKNIVGKFDLIVFNSPYIDDRTGNHLGIFNESLSQKRWSGGHDGLEIIRQFIKETAEHLTENGIAALGFNCFYITINQVKMEIEYYHLNIKKINYNVFTKACVIEFERGN